MIEIMKVCYYIKYNYIILMKSGKQKSFTHADCSRVFENYLI